MTAATSWLALDIGGANLKAAHTSGMTRSIPFALWKHPERLPESLASLADEWPPYRNLAVTMTGELCDCFATKAYGVKTILNAVLYARAERKVRVWTLSGTFATVLDVQRSPEAAAAANWLALATWAARLAPSGLLIDIGSTTTDLIPVRDGLPTPSGRTDTERLRSGELVYVGVKRTPICAIAAALPHRGSMTGLAAELFATTRDVYLTLDDLAEDPRDLDTSDGRPATKAASRDRLARMVGADREGFSEADALAYARHADASLMDRLVDSAMRVSRDRLGDRPRVVVISGSGEFLARRLAERIIAPGGSIVSLSELWGRGASDCACAYALMLLAGETGGAEP